jgi:hypothetical protein
MKVADLTTDMYIFSNGSFLEVLDLVMEPSGRVMEIQLKRQNGHIIKVKANINDGIMAKEELTEADMILAHAGFRPDSTFEHWTRKLDASHRKPSNDNAYIIAKYFDGCWTVLNSLGSFVATAYSGEKLLAMCREQYRRLASMQ